MQKKTSDMPDNSANDFDSSPLAQFTYDQLQSLDERVHDLLETFSTAAEEARSLARKYAWNVKKRPYHCTIQHAYQQLCTLAQRAKDELNFSKQAQPARSHGIISVHKQASYEELTSLDQRAQSLHKIFTGAVEKTEKIRQESRCAPYSYAQEPVEKSYNILSELAELVKVERSERALALATPLDFKRDFPAYIVAVVEAALPKKAALFPTYTELSPEERKERILERTKKYNRQTMGITYRQAFALSYTYGPKPASRQDIARSFSLAPKTISSDVKKGLACIAKALNP